MKIGHQIKFLVINKQANSLHALIADGKYRNTSLGRNTWKTLIGSEASLQLNCDKEGFNTAGSKMGHSKARIGTLQTIGKTTKALTRESALVLEGSVMTPTRVETMLIQRLQITERRTLKQWGTYWFSKVPFQNLLMEQHL